MSGCRQGVPWVGDARGSRRARNSGGAAGGGRVAPPSARGPGCSRSPTGSRSAPPARRSRRASTPRRGGARPAVVGARDDDHLALAREVAAHVAALARPLAPALAEGAERLQVRDEAVGEPVWEHLRGLDLGAALGARGRVVYPFGDAGSAEYMPVAGATVDSALFAPGGSDLRICGHYPHGVRSGLSSTLIQIGQSRFGSGACTSVSFASIPAAGTRAVGTEAPQLALDSRPSRGTGNLSAPSRPRAPIFD